LVKPQAEQYREHQQDSLTTKPAPVTEYAPDFYIPIMGTRNHTRTWWNVPFREGHGVASLPLWPQQSRPAHP